MSISQNMVGIAKNKSLLKEYQNRVVYLTDGDEFQIMLFNPTESKIAAKIKINGSQIPNMVVLRPGERVWLDRYLDVNRKFKFSTYTVDKSNEALNAIRNNGTIEISFHYEHVKRNVIICDSAITTGTNNDFVTTTLPKTYPITWEISSSTAGFPSVSTAYYASTNLSNSIGVNTSITSECDAKKAKISEELETGRIEEGGISEQRFNEDYSDFSYYSFKTETLKILPISQKPYNKQDIEKKYCTECGRKLNPKFKYCPTCGAKC